MKRALLIAGGLLLLGIIGWFFPLFHVVSREALRAEREQQVFRADEYVKAFWSGKLRPAFADAEDAVTVLAALRESPEQAATMYGRKAGLGRSTLYFLRGSGTIVSVDKSRIGVKLGGDGGEADVALASGLLFGNTARDASGLLNGDDFPNSQQFNEISTELNRTIESNVLPSLKERAQVGDAIEFIGCAEVTNVPRDITPLKVVPLEVTWK